MLSLTKQLKISIESLNTFFKTTLKVANNSSKPSMQNANNLVSFPKMGRSYSHIRADVRGIALSGFIILYRTSGASSTLYIEILRVVSGRRDLNSIFSTD
jgi:toxin ParE1/3/4